jgi:hypothetical protein
MSNSKLTNNQKEKIEQILLDSIRSLIKELNIQADEPIEPPFVWETEIDLTFEGLGSQNEGYDVKCFDGYAIANNGIIEVNLSYPFMYQFDAEQIKDIYRYRYSNDPENKYEITFGDIMMKHSKLESFKIL